MFNTEEIQSWNEIFKAKIQETDLKNPSEAFLVRTLIAYLQHFGYNLDFPDFPENNNSNSRERRLFLIRLAYNIDRILKFTDKSLGFYYYDLVKPVPKKTSHILGMLLNYYYYYAMFKNEVFQMDGGRIKEMRKLVDTIEATERDNAEQHGVLVQMNKEIAELSTMVPIAKGKLDALKSKKSIQDERLHVESEELEDLNKKLADLRTQERILRKQVIEDDEARKLQSELNDIQANINEHLSTINNSESVLSERVEVIRDLDRLLKLLQDAKNIFPSDLLDDSKDLTKKMKQSMSEYELISRKKVSLLETIAKQESELQNIRENLKLKTQQYDQEKMEKYANITEMEALCTSKQQELNDLRLQVECLKNQVEDQRQTFFALQNAISKIMSRYNNCAKHR